MRVTQIIRQPAPYRTDCFDSYPAGFTDPTLNNTIYSHDQCEHLCLIKYIQSKCNCTDAYLMEARNELNFNEFNFCSSDKWSCADGAAHTYSSMIDPDSPQTSCPCKLACVEQDYQVTTLNGTFG